MGMKSKNLLKTYFIKTFGCQMNYSDSERIAAIFQTLDLKAINQIDKADVVIFNTCSVRQSAEDRIFGLKKNILLLKQKHNTKYKSTKYKLPITILTGCMCKRSWDISDKKSRSREEKYLKKLKQKLPWIDIIIEIKNINKLLNIFNNNLSSKTITKQSICNKSGQNYLSIKPSRVSQTSAYVPISTGCNEFCSYCIVPFTRGLQIDRPAGIILNEVQKLIAKGYKDIMLLGQNVNAYNFRTNNSQQTFLDLLKTIDNIKGNYWLSFLSSHPNYFTDDLIYYFAKSTNKATSRILNHKRLTTGSHIRPYLNLALQSGSNKILKLMNRKYSVEKFINICKKLKQKVPNLNLSTDIIVGFPSETEKDFEKTINIFKKLQFDMAYINKYSPREGTASATLEDNISLETKKKRAKKLTKILAQTALKNNRKYLGKNVRVFIKKINKLEKIAFGKTFNFKDIEIVLKTTDKISKGSFVTVKVERTGSWSLKGKLIKS